MDVRRFLAAAEARGWLRHIDAPVDPNLELANVLHALGEEPVVLSSVAGWGGAVVAGINCGRKGCKPPTRAEVDAVLGK